MAWNYAKCSWQIMYYKILVRRQMCGKCENTSENDFLKFSLHIPRSIGRHYMHRYDWACARAALIIPAVPHSITSSLLKNHAKPRIFDWFFGRSQTVFPPECVFWPVVQSRHVEMFVGFRLDRMVEYRNDTTSEQFPANQSANVFATSS